jgi:membrane dipeptidase
MPPTPHTPHPNIPPLDQRQRVLDLHADPLLIHRLFGYDLARKHRAGIPGQPFFWHTDLPRMREAGYLGVCLGVHYWPWSSEGGWAELRHQVALADRYAASTPNCIRVRCADDWDTVQRTPDALGVAVGVEGAHMLNGRLDRVPLLADLGVSYLTLAHFVGNVGVSPSMGRGANTTRGLTTWGRALIRALNDAGVAVDVAHVNRPGVLDACATTRAPLLCTHTGAAALSPSARNLSDAELDAVAATGGVIGVIFGPHFLIGALHTSSEAIVNHIEYIAARVGVQHVAIGTDYDGWMPAIPYDQRDCRDISQVTRGLLRRGFSQDDVAAISHGNALRCLKAAWAARSIYYPTV